MIVDYNVCKETMEGHFKAGFECETCRWKMPIEAETYDLNIFNSVFNNYIESLEHLQVNLKEKDYSILSLEKKISNSKIILTSQEEIVKKMESVVLQNLTEDLEYGYIEDKYKIFSVIQTYTSDDEFKESFNDLSKKHLEKQGFFKKQYLKRNLRYFIPIIQHMLVNQKNADLDKWRRQRKADLKKQVHKTVKKEVKELISFIKKECSLQIRLKRKEQESKKEERIKNIVFKGDLANYRFLIGFGVLAFFGLIYLANSTLDMPNLDIKIKIASSLSCLGAFGFILIAAGKYSKISRNFEILKERINEQKHNEIIGEVKLKTDLAKVDNTTEAQSFLDLIKDIIPKVNPKK